MTFCFGRPARLLPFLAAVLLTGCYNRWTGNYSAVPELENENGVILETAELSPEEQRKQLEELRKLADEAPPAYTINSGDKLEVVVYNHPDLSTKITVTPDGYLGMVLVGQLKVSGLTIAEAAAKLEEALSRYIKNPKVGLSPYEIVSQTATIAGAVNHSGSYPIDDGMRLADLFAKAGGAALHYYDGQTMSAADFEHSFFIRAHKTLPVDFIKAIEKCLNKKAVLNLLPLQPGDVIQTWADTSSIQRDIGFCPRTDIQSGVSNFVKWYREFYGC